MIWIALAALTGLTLLPLVLSLRHGAQLRDQRAAALSLHRAQLAELEQERATGQIGVAEYEAALLEVQRRLLAADAARGKDSPGAVQFPLAVLFPLLPLIATVLYLVGGVPGMEAQPLAARRAAEARHAAQEDALIRQLRQRLAGMDARGEQGRRGYMLLGNAEMRRGNAREAAAAWRVALESGFDPTIAVMTGAAITQVEGKVTAEAAALFRRALAEGPKDAPWRAMVEQQLKDAPP
jgi:cytochrome c-type biogenesis protein CcmH